MNGNFKVRCVDTNDMSCVTKNKIYNIINGRLLYDDGFYKYGIIDFNNLKCRSSAKWELIEEKENEMEDLRKLIKPCMVVKLEEGNFNIVVDTKEGMGFVDNDGFNSNLKEYDNDLRHRTYTDLNIVEIFDICDILCDSQEISINNRTLLWSRPIEKSSTELKISEMESTVAELNKQIDELKKEIKK